MAYMTETDKGGDTVDYLDVDGYRIPRFAETAEEGTEIFKYIKRFPCRHDDVFILAPVKAGTHWTWEIVSMLLNGKAETIPKRKGQQMLECMGKDVWEPLPSPRVLNSHVNIRYLPEEMFQKKCKIIYVLRNPKDMVVSWYNHTKGFVVYNYTGKWENFLELFLEEKLDYGSWFEYVREWEQLMKERPDLPIHVVHYEDLKKNLLLEIQRLSAFLGVADDTDLQHAVVEKCSFRTMAKDKVYTEELRKIIFQGNFSVFRKGEVGDWKNWFTVAQNERFDILYDERMRGSNLKFQYSI